MGNLLKACGFGHTGVSSPNHLASFRLSAQASRELCRDSTRVSEAPHWRQWPLGCTALQDRSQKAHLPCPGYSFCNTVFRSGWKLGEHPTLTGWLSAAFPHHFLTQQNKSDTSGKQQKGEWVELGVRANRRYRMTNLAKMSALPFVFVRFPRRLESPETSTVHPLPPPPISFFLSPAIPPNPPTPQPPQPPNPPTPPTPPTPARDPRGGLGPRDAGGRHGGLRRQVRELGVLRRLQLRGGPQAPRNWGLPGTPRPGSAVLGLRFLFSPSLFVCLVRERGSNFGGPFFGLQESTSPKWKGIWATF